MIRKMQKLIVLLALLLFVFECAGADQSQPRFSWDTVPQWGFYRAISDNQILSGHQHETMAKRYSLIVVWRKLDEKSFQIASELKSAQPDTSVIWYLNTTIPQMLQDDSFSIDDSWLLRDADGVPAEVSFNRNAFDLTVEDCRRWWVGMSGKAVAGGFDGIFADGVPKYGKLDNQEMDVYSWRAGQRQAMRDALHALLRETAEETGPDSQLIFNGLRAREKGWDGGISFLTHTSGGLAEHFGAFSARDENGNLKPEVVQSEFEVMHQATQMGKIVLVKGWPGNNTPWTEGFNEKTRDQKLDILREQLEFSLAIFLIAAQENYYFGYSWGYGIEDGWLEELDELKRPLGPPKGAAKKNGWIYTRQFEHASVWVDIENEKATIDWH